MLSEILWHQPLTFVLFFLSLVTSLVLGEEIVRFSRLGSLCTRAEYITWSLFHNWPWQEVLVFCINSLHRHLDVCGLFENIQQKECWVIPQTVVYSEQRNWKQKQKLLRKKKENFKKSKARFCLSIDVTTDSWLNGLNEIKTKLAFVKDQLKYSSKIATAASQCSPYGISFK